MILVLGGTTEAFRVSEELLRDGRDFVMTTATAYGLERFSQRFGQRVIHIRFSREGLRAFIRKWEINEIIDCTHPYAEEITEIAKEIAGEMGIIYHCEKRDTGGPLDLDYEKAVTVESLTEAAEFIKSHDIRRPLFTTGSKDLSFVSILKGIEVFVRVLPYEVSIRRCHEAGIRRSNIIAMEGPFSTELNTAIIRQYFIDCIVTKMSGREGGFLEKIAAARNEGIWIIVIRRRIDV